MATPKQTILLNKKNQLDKELNNLYREMKTIAKKSSNDIDYKEAMGPLHHYETLIHAKKYAVDLLLEMEKID